MTRTLRTGGMVRATARPATVAPGSRVSADGHPLPEFRAELRRIPGARNALSVASVGAQTAAIMWAAVAWHHPAGYAVAFVLMGRAHAQCLALMHESAHRLLFRSRRINDAVGRWVVGAVSFVNVDAYRTAHMAHHREEFGPNEPDLPLYANYPVPRASFWRKMRRDATGATGLRLLRAVLRGVRRDDPRARRATWRILAVQGALLGASTVLASPLVYLGLWLAPWLTVWQVMNRLRAIAEHGGLRADDDRRTTTHDVRQHAIARLLFVPYRLGWHLAHHADPGVPFRSLPRFHDELRRAGWITDAETYPSYRALWRALRTD